MKKLLLAAALMALGATSYAELTPDGATQDVKSEVLVRAQIVDDVLKITDIYGNPLVLDFKRLPKQDYSKDVAKASVEYKITAKEALAGDMNLNMSLTAFEKPEDTTGIRTVKITKEEITNKAAATVNQKVTVNLSLDSDKKVIPAKQKTAIGRINGIINSDLSNKETGTYTGKVYLYADVQ